MFDILLPTSGTGDALRATLTSVSASTLQPSRVVLVLDGVQLNALEREWVRSLPFEVYTLEQPRAGVTGALVRTWVLRRTPA